MDQLFINLSNKTREVPSLLLGVLEATKKMNHGSELKCGKLYKYLHILLSGFVYIILFNSKNKFWKYTG